MLKPSAVKKLFMNVLGSAEENINRFVRSPGRDMTRHRKCPLPDTILVLMSMSMGRTNTELLDYFSSQGRHVVSKSAFCQQRGKLSDALLPHIFAAFNDATPMKKRFRGYTLLAVDGSDVNIPTDRHDTAFAVKQARSDGHYYQMHVNALYDICENRYRDAIVQPRPGIDENAALVRMARKHAGKGSCVFIADRGYASLNTFAALSGNGNRFLIRCKSPDSPGSLLRNLVNGDGEPDTTVTIGITRSRKKCCLKQPGMYKCIGTRGKFDPIPHDDRETVYHMTLRIVAVKAGNGATEYLATNLCEKEFPASDIGVLYRMRWGIETSFRRLKHALSLVYFHSVRRDFIIQELYAKLILYNLSSLLHAYAEGERDRRERDRHYRHPRKVSFDDTVPVARRFLRFRMTNGTVLSLLLSHISSVRNEKPHPRNVRSQSVKPLNYRG